MSSTDTREPPDPDDEYTGEVLPALPAVSVPPATTRRQARLATQRKRKRTTLFTVLSAALVVLAIGVVVIPMLARTQGRPSTAATTDDVGTGSETAVAAADASVFVLVTHADDPDSPADSITLLGLNPASDHGAAVFVPVGLLLEVPGIGLERVALAQRYGGVGLVQDSLAEALDIDIDAAAALGEAGLASLLGAAGELTVDVGDAELVSAGEQEQVRFEAGEQTLDGDRLADYWTLLAEGEQQLSELPRQQQVLEALLAEVADDPDILDRALTAGVLDPTSTAGPEALRGVLTQLAGAQAEGQLAFGILPVRPFGGVAEDGTSTYRVGDEAETALLALLSGDGEATRVEVRNAGGPDFADRSADANLVQEALGEDFRVTLGVPSTEAPSAETQIIIYADTPEARERAETVQRLLGVGTITVDEQPQTVVDLTILLGEDFPADGGAGDAEQDT